MNSYEAGLDFVRFDRIVVGGSDCPPCIEDGMERESPTWSYPGGFTYVCIP